MRSQRPYVSEEAGRLVEASSLLVGDAVADELVVVVVVVVDGLDRLVADADVVTELDPFRIA